MLNWENIKNDSCPACGYFMTETDKGWECNNHRGKPFSIPKKRFVEIKRDLQEKEDFAFPKF